MNTPWLFKILLIKPKNEQALLNDKTHTENNCIL
jgi:hypothetical protein